MAALLKVVANWLMEPMVPMLLAVVAFEMSAHKWDSFRLANRLHLIERSID